MDVFDENLKKLRLPAPVLKLLVENKISSLKEFLESESLLEETRKHLNPIQHSKLNAAIKEYDEADEDASDYNGLEIILNRENSASRQEIVEQLELERHYLDELNGCIMEDTKVMTDGAKQIILKSKAAHQARANRLNIILRKRAPQADDPPTLLSRADPKKNTIIAKKVTFDVIEKPKTDENQEKSALYNSPRAKEGVRLFSGLNVFADVFSSAKDVISTFMHGSTSSTEPACAVEPTESHYYTRSSHPDKRMRVEGPSNSEALIRAEWSAQRDSIAEQHHTYQWRMSLIQRLAGTCKLTAKYNHRYIMYSNDLQEWIQRNSMFDLQIFRPFSWPTKQDMQDCAQAIRNDKQRLNRRRRHLERELSDIRELVLAWNIESMRLNMSLIENPHLDQSSFLKPLMLLQPSRGLFCIRTQHSHDMLVQPGDSVDGPFLYRVEYAMSKLY